MRKPKFSTFRDSVAVVSPQGRLVLGEMNLLREAVDAAITNDYTTIVIDLAEVDKIDAAGLGELVGYYVQARQAGSLLALRSPAARIQDLLVITKLVAVFPILDPDVLPNVA